MVDPDIAQTGLARAVARFPEGAETLHRLSLIHPGFREICEDYALAQLSLARFEGRPDAAERAEIAEYRTLIAELEREIDRIMREAAPEG